MSIALIWNTFITCHFSIWIFESFISGSHSPLYPFSFLLWRVWGAYDGTCLLSSAPHTQGRVWGQGVGGVCLLLEWVVTAGPCRVRTEAPSCVPAPCVCFSSSPSPAFLFLLHVHCDSILFSSLFFCFWSHRVTCMTSSPTREWTQALGNESPES